MSSEAMKPSERLYELAAARGVQNPAMFTAGDLATVLDEMEERIEKLEKPMLLLNKTVAEPGEAGDIGVMGHDGVVRWSKQVRSLRSLLQWLYEESFEREDAGDFILSLREQLEARGFKR